MLHKPKTIPPSAFPVLARLSSGLAILALGLAGCERPSSRPAETRQVPEVAVVRPARASLHWTVRQPGSIEAFEQTAIVPKIAGYVQKWNVDIGDRVKKGEVLAVLWVPDLVQELDQRRAEVEQAQRMFEVAKAHVASAAALVVEAKAGVRRAQANLAYRKSQHNRVSQLLERSVINKEVQDEAVSELQAAEASVSEAEAKVARAAADHKETEAARDKSLVDISVAQAALAKMQSVVDYATLRAPFDGVVTRRNINTGDFVQPPAASPKDGLYIIERRDLMRVFVEVPEADAVWVYVGAPARIGIPILKGREYAGMVRRMSYSLKQQSRTLVAEIDLPNPEDRLRPGMYATAAIEVMVADVLTLPSTAVASQGDVNEGYQDHCFVLENRKLVRTPVEIGSRGDGRVEVLQKNFQGTWVEFSGDEAVVAGELASLVDGQEVTIVADRQDLACMSHRANDSSIVGTKGEAQRAVFGPNPQPLMLRGLASRRDNHIPVPQDNALRDK